jgi:hypothetical protein
VHGQLGRVGAGQQVGDAQQVDETLLGDPTPALDDLATDQRDVCRRTAKADQAEQPEQPG